MKRMKPVHITQNIKETLSEMLDTFVQYGYFLVWLLRDSPPVAADFLAGGVVFGDELNPTSKVASWVPTEPTRLKRYGTIPYTT